MIDLTEAIRQFKHNDGSEGFVIGYDEETIDSIVNDAATEIKLITKENKKLRQKNDNWLDVNENLLADKKELEGGVAYYAAKCEQLKSVRVDCAITSNRETERRIKVKSEIDRLTKENERFSERDGKATVSLSYETAGYPFNHTDLTVCDFGVADNGYVVNSEFVNTLVAERDRLREALESIIENRPHPKHREYLREIAIEALKQ